MKKLLILLAIAASTFSILHANLQEGTAKAFQVKGDVTLVNNQTGQSVRMKRGMEVTQGHTILTGATSKALLLLSNGGTINVSENSRVNLLRFLQAPWDKKSAGQYLMLKQDPSTSDTLIRLDHGEMVGKVKPLQPDSFYDVETPIGSAGVRGTTYLVSFFMTEDGQLMMKVGNIEGRVLITTKMPANVTVSESGVAEADMDPTATLSTGDVPEKSIVLIKAKPEDVDTVGNIPIGRTPLSYAEAARLAQQAIADVENPERVEGTNDIFIFQNDDEDNEEDGPPENIIELSLVGSDATNEQANNTQTSPAPTPAAPAAPASTPSIQDIINDAIAAQPSSGGSTSGGSTSGGSTSGGSTSGGSTSGGSTSGGTLLF